MEQRQDMKRKDWGDTRESMIIAACLYLLLLLRLVNESPCCLVVTNIDGIHV